MKEEAPQSGVAVRFTIADAAELDGVLDAWIAFIEDHRLLFGGGGTGSVVRGFVTARDGSVTDTLRALIRRWLEERRHVAAFRVGVPVDAECPDAFERSMDRAGRVH